MAPGICAQDLAELVANARFFATGNLIRFVLTAPLAVALYLNHRVLLVGFTASVLIVHLAAFAVEAYRMDLARRLLPDSECRRAPQSPKWTPAAGWFRRRPFETELLYRRLGAVRVIAWLASYTRKVSGDSTGARRAGAPALRAFYEQTKTSEAVHSILFLVQVALVMATPPAAWWTALGPAFLIVLDTSMVLTQRYHRVRLEPILRRREGRA